MASSAIGQGEAADIAHAFIRARRENRVLMRYPNARMPASLDDAYRIQEAAIALDGRKLLGWKVGRIAEPLVTDFGNVRLAGPIFNIIAERDDNDPPPIMPVLAGFAAVEGELLVRIAPNAAQADIKSSPATLIDAVHLGIEIASSPFPGINGHGPAVTVSDFGNNHGAVMGPDLLHHSIDAIFESPMTVLIDGEVAGKGRPIDVLDGPYGAVRFIIDHMRRRNLGDAAGLWVSCGAVTGVHPVRAANEVEVQLLDARVRCRTSGVTLAGSHNS